MRQIKRLAVCAVAVLCAGTASAAKWTNATSNTPDTKYLWSVKENWQDEAIGGEGDSVEIKPSNKVFILKDTSAAPLKISGSNDKAFLLGGLTVRDTSSGTSDIVGGINIYGNIVYEASKQCLVTATPNFCGKVSYSGTNSRRLAVASGGVNFRFDRYANSSSALRTDDLDDLKYFSIGNGTAAFYAPVGATATNGTWRLTEGSPFAYRTSPIAHPLAVGTIVTAAGYLDGGTYLKHVFDDATIELSQPAVQSGEVTLSFAAFTPNFTATFTTPFSLQGGGPVMQFTKTRASDVARIVIPTLNSTYAPGVPTLGNASSTAILGTFVVKSFAGTWAESGAYLRNIHFELDDNASTATNHTFRFDGSYTARFTVTNNLASTIAAMRVFEGTLVKDGAGALTVGFNDAANAGSITVEGGTFTIAKNETAGDGALSFANVTLAAGTTLTVPASGIRVTKLATSGSVTIRGGKVTAGNGTDRSAINLAGITLADGATLEFVMDGDPEDGALILGNVTPQVAGHPAFWVDASKPETIVCATENGTNFVTRWNDCREGEPMFCTNINATVRATYTNGSDMAHKYVRIANVPNVSDYRDTQQLVWSVPIRSIKAVFLVQDPTEGGGMLLGRCGWRLPDTLYSNSWAGPFYRENALDWNMPVVYNTGSTINCVRYGRLYLNGKSARIGASYLGAYMQLIDFHANTNYITSTSTIDCDAFGGCYHNGSPANLSNKNGGMRIAEYIIYTNTLTHAERVQVEQYLSRKWLNRNIYYLPVDESRTSASADVAALDGAVEVPAGRTAAISAVTAGSITKTGDGTLYVNGLDGASMSVEGGNVTLAAMTRQRYVPTDAWIHVDAMKEDSLTKDGDEVNRWYDVNGTGASFRNHATPKATFAQSGVNGHPAVDLGESGGTDKSSLVYYTPEGAVAPSYAELPAVMKTPYIRTAFAVYNSAGGGGSIFGGGGAAYPSKGLPHRHSNGDNSPIIDAPAEHFIGHGLTAISNALVNGTAIFRRNGANVDPFVATFLKDDELVTFAHHADGRKISHLCMYGQGLSTRGGLKYGEVALFERRLTADEIDGTEAYLAKKWFGTDTPGYGSAAGAVSVGAGASLTILGSDFSATSLGGAGTVTGDVTLSDDGGIVAVVKDDGTIDGMTVNGALRLNGGTVTLTGAVANIRPGVYTVLSANSLVNAGGAWTMPSVHRFVFSLSFTGTSATLTVSKAGLKVILR